MKPRHDEALHVRLTPDLMRDLDDAARSSGTRLSKVAREALAIGVRVLRSSSGDDRDPPPAGAPSSLAAAA